jgi:transcriptional regulator with XRE-family HTH domain
MLKSDVYAHFKSSPRAIARTLGISRSAVQQWPKVVPLKSALKLEALTKGALRVDMSAYELPPLPDRRTDRRHATA